MLILTLCQNSLLSLAPQAATAVLAPLLLLSVVSLPAGTLRNGNQQSVRSCATARHMHW